MTLGPQPAPTSQSMVPCGPPVVTEMSGSTRPPTVPEAAAVLPAMVPLPPSPQKSTEPLQQAAQQQLVQQPQPQRPLAVSSAQSAESAGTLPRVEAERPAAAGEAVASKPGPYVSPGRRALLGRRRSPPPPPEPAQPSGPFQCVTFVDGKPVLGPVDDSMFKIQDIRLKEGHLKQEQQ